MSHQKTAKCHIKNRPSVTFAPTIYLISNKKAFSLRHNKKSTHKNKKTAFLMVLTGVGNYAYKRPEDGVLVAPIGCLKD